MSLLLNQNSQSTQDPDFFLLSEALEFCFSLLDWRAAGVFKKVSKRLQNHSTDQL